MAVNDCARFFKINNQQSSFIIRQSSGDVRTEDRIDD